MCRDRINNRFDSWRQVAVPALSGYCRATFVRSPFRPVGDLKVHCDEAPKSHRFSSVSLGRCFLALDPPARERSMSSHTRIDEIPQL